MKPQTIYDLLKDWSIQEPDSIYLEDDEERLSVLDVFCQVNSLMELLRKQGLKKGDRVLLRATRRKETMLLFFALCSIGAVTYLATPYEKAEDFLKEENLALPILSDEEGAFAFRNEKLDFQSAPSSLQKPDDDIDRFSIVLFTSGSTGRRKGVMLNEKSLLLGDYNTLPIGDYRKGDVSGAILPLDHVFGLCLILASLLSRHTAYFPSRMNMKSLIFSLKEHHVTRLNGVPSLYQALADELEKEKESLPELRIGLLGGSPSDPNQILRLEESLSMRLLSVYGMSECCTISCISVSDPVIKSIHTLGKPYPHVKVKLVPLTDSPYQEICIKSEGMLLGYLNQDSPFDEEGYLRTGDLGSLDEDGYLLLTGRKKDIIIRNGQNLVSKVIEDAFLMLKEVREAAVVSKKDEKEGEIPFLFLSLKERGNPKSILNQANLLLKKNERITQYRILDELPHTLTGKIDKERLRKSV